MCRGDLVSQERQEEAVNPKMDAETETETAKDEKHFQDGEETDENPQLGADEEDEEAVSSATSTSSEGGSFRLEEEGAKLGQSFADEEEAPAPAAEVQSAPPAGCFRAKYLQKLTNNRVLVEAHKRPPKHQTMIIFDWDDTLLCTHWLERFGIPSNAAARCLQKIGEMAANLLEAATKLGHTFIITNAQTGWVELSAKRWAPALLPVLQKVQVISARDSHVQDFPDNIDMWKISAFLEVRKRFDNELVTNLIAVGDSHYEMNAIFAMAKEFEYKLVKTIRFQTRPTPSELLRQLELVAAKFEKIVEASRNMTIALERKPTAPPS